MRRRQAALRTAGQDSVARVRAGHARRSRTRGRHLHRARFPRRCAGSSHDMDRGNLGTGNPHPEQTETPPTAGACCGLSGNGIRLDSSSAWSSGVAISVGTELRLGALVGRASGAPTPLNHVVRSNCGLQGARGVASCGDPSLTDPLLTAADVPVFLVERAAGPPLRAHP